MDDQYSVNNIDSLLLRLALQTREVSQKKTELSQQIKVCRAEIAERRSYTQTMHRNIKKLEEEISVKQSTVMHNRANTKSMKATCNLLLQYEQTLKAELESRKAIYNHDTEVYEERIASYRKTLQSHKDYYFQNPMAQKLLMLQAEKQVIESRIKTWEDLITMKQQELDCLTGPAVTSFSTEKLPDSMFGQQPTTEQEAHLHCQTEDSDSSTGISSLQLNQTGTGLKTSAEVNTEEIEEENEVQDSPTCCSSPEKASKELWSYQQLDEQSQPEMHAEEQGQGTSQEDQEQQPSVSAVEEVLEDEMPERAATDEDQAPSEEDNEGLFPHTSSQATNLQSVPVKAVPSTPTCPFNFSFASSSHQGASDTKSPAFLFSLNSDPSTPGFSGFGHEAGSSQEEKLPFAFTGSFFNEKKSTESKSARYPEFLFGQPEQSEDFQFAFTSKSPQSADKENTGDGFPFSFNF